MSHTSPVQRPSVPRAAAATAADDDLRAEARQLDRGGTAETGAAATEEHHLPVEQAGREDLRGHRAGQRSAV
jgi:hypothetical protein